MFSQVHIQILEGSGGGWLMNESPLVSWQLALASTAAPGGILDVAILPRQKHNLTCPGLGLLVTKMPVV